MKDLSKLCLHTITTKPWNIETAIEKYAKAGVKGISVWRDAVEGRDLAATGKKIRDAGLEIVSLVRGGFYPAKDAAERKTKIEENKRIVDEAAALGAPAIVLVTGAVIGQSLDESRKQITEGIAETARYAQGKGVKLSIEPLHPMYADIRSAVNTLKSANDMCQELAMPNVGVAVDVFHVWWEPNLKAEIQRCGKNGWLYAFHICDWKTPMADMLNDRGLMGEGCINNREIREWVEAAGFSGCNEVEIFSTRYWAMDQDEYLAKIIEAYKTHV